MLRRASTIEFMLGALLATAVVLVLFLGNLIASRQGELTAGEQRTHHFAIMMAENTARAFEAIELLLRETATDLQRNQPRWKNWDDETGWEYTSHKHSHAMPLLRSISLYDEKGQHRQLSTRFPAPRHDISHEAFFEQLKDGRPAMSFGPFVSPADRRFSFGLARRLDNPDFSFAGIVLAAVDPMYLQDICWPARLADEFETVLINDAGQIIASCRPSDTSHQSDLLGTPFTTSLFDGQLANASIEPGINRHQGLVLAITRVPAFPDLRVLTVVPQSTLLASWHTRLIELGALTLLMSVMIVLGGLVLRRQLLNAQEMAKELALSRDQLSLRIQEATEEVAAQRDEADRANRAKSRFLAAASHDLRQPLHALALFSADLLRQVRNKQLKDIPHLAEQIGTSTSILGELLDSLLDVSRLDMAQISPQKHPCALQAIFDHIGASYRRAAMDRRQVLRIRPTPLWVHSDAALLERVIANLLSNAIRYTPSGGRILITARKRGNSVLIEVRDNGVGIAPEHQEIIFTEFYQVENAAREHGKGLGLGLSIVDRVVKALGISIQLQSAVGRGTCFKLTLPHSLPHQAVEQPEEASPPLQILLIGTGEIIDQALKTIKDWGYDTRTQSYPDSPPPMPNRRQIILCEHSSAAQTLDIWPGQICLIVLAPEGSTAPPPRTKDDIIHLLPLPIRPAKLRALLGQIQKTLSKSIP